MSIDLDRIIDGMAAFGATQFLFKELAPNDNSKNQVYFGGSLDILNVLPMGAITSETTERGVAILKASLNYSWLQENGQRAQAPNAQLILYPQYPEVRFSGFLRGSPGAPNSIMASRDPGRILLLGIAPNGEVIGWAGSIETIRGQLAAMQSHLFIGPFRYLNVRSDQDAEARLLNRLAAIAREGWLSARRLYSNGVLGPCRGVNCGGYTLEAWLGIIPNGRSDPDFEGWEIKAHTVSTFGKLAVGQLTLMTPEPSGGVYRTEGAPAFIRRFGYPDASVPGRINFSSPHRFGVRNERTGLTLGVRGFDAVSGKITDAHGAVELLTVDDTVAADWSFAKLLEHWNHKHERAAYTPYLVQAGEPVRFHYGDRVRLGRRTNFLRFLSALASGAVWHDPGLKLEAVGTAHPKLKRRNQFRMRSANLDQLYEHFEERLLFRDEWPTVR